MKLITNNTCKAFRILSVILSEAKNLTVLAEILPVGQNDKEGRTDCITPRAVIQLFSYSELTHGN